MTKEKSAEDWIKEHFGVAYVDDIEPLRVNVVADSMLVNWVKKIQRNARHAAMLEAAEIVHTFPSVCKYHGSEDSQTMSIEQPDRGDYKDAILTAAAEKYKD